MVGSWREQVQAQHFEENSFFFVWGPEMPRM